MSHTGITKEKALRLANNILALIEKDREKLKQETIVSRIASRDFWRKWLPLCRLWCSVLTEEDAASPEFGRFGVNDWEILYWEQKQTAENVKRLAEMSDNDFVYVDEKQMREIV